MLKNSNISSDLPGNKVISSLTYFIETYGCQMNVSDSELVSNELEKIGYTRSEKIELADLILPSSLFLEKDFTTINLENRIKVSKSLRKISGDVRSEYFLLLVLISFLNSKLNLGELKKKYIFDQLFTKEYPFIAKNNFKIAEFLIDKVNYSTLRNEILSSRFIDFYEDNSIIRSSRNFKFCLNNLKKVQFRKKNVI